MKYTKSIVLKDGTECLLRGANGDDAEEMYNIFNLTHSQTDFLLSYPDENSFDVEGEREFLAAHDASNNAIELAAFVNGKMVGSAGIEPVGKKDKVKHRAEFGISVEKAFWNMGIGRALTVACIECAKTAGYLQLELDAVAENSHALSLYESVGFVEYGRNPRGFKNREDKWQELVLMRLELDK